MAVFTTETDLPPELATYARDPSTDDATPAGSAPTGTDEVVYVGSTAAAVTVLPRRGMDASASIVSAAEGVPGSPAATGAGARTATIVDANLRGIGCGNGDSAGADVGVVNAAMGKASTVVQGTAAGGGISGSA
ncbi:hypothetical protein [Mycolicibacterium psychrotolerans]|uniref:Uncharacterized protein n=1 Tax=Mycolicibacterium psychrotolerans TaxID=216929 RepID=A0A7I7ME13_9MYCO|nr:hypothetical protein [Mycolicibacterium psychrotolerans]BBX70561.1 hypothetical protein MPSYJ_40220 [Mycolicibacterium psychrotolerans]